MDIEKILRMTVLGGVFALPFIVLVVAHPLFFPFITGKNFLFRVVIEVIFAAWLLLAFFSASYRPRLSYVFLSIVAFVGIVGLANLLGENPVKSIWSNFERIEGYVTLLHLLAYIIAATGVLTQSSQWLWFWRVSLGVSTFVTLDALAQFLLTDKFRLDATLGNPIYLAVYVLFHIFIALVLLVRRGAVKLEQLFYAATLPFHAWVLYLTATRGATLGVIGGLMLSAGGVMLTTEKESTRKKVAAGLLIALALLVLGFWVAKDSAFVQEHRVLKRFSNISLTEGTIFARTLVWGAALEGFKERPLLGYGQENFNVVFNEYYDPRLYNRELWYDRTHNAVFDWLIAAGLLGLLAYLSIFLALLWTLYTTQQFTRVQKWLLTGLLAAYAFHNLTVFDQVISYILFFSLAAWIAMSAPDVWGRAHANKSGATTVPFWAVPVAFVIAALLVWGVNSSAFRANVTLLRAISHAERALVLGRDGDITKARDFSIKSFELFTQAEELGPLGRQETREHLAQIAGHFAKVGWMKDSEKQQWLLRAETGLEEQIAVAPNDARFYTFLGSLYSSFGEHTDAQKALLEAHALTPKKQIILIRLATNADSRGYANEALQFAQDAWELEVSNALARRHYVLRLLERDDIKTTREVLERSGPHIVDREILRALVRGGYHEDAHALWQQSVQLSNWNPNIVFFLVELYKQEGDEQRAQEALEQVGQVLPGA